MRTKILLGLAVLAVSASTLVAQVYSLNIVGYVNQAVPAAAGGAPAFVLVGNPLSASPNNTVGTVLGTQLPTGASILTWNGISFDENVFNGPAGWDDPTPLVAPGMGFFIKNPTATAFNVTFVGEVLAGKQTNSMGAAFNLVSSKVPIAGDLSTNPNLALTNAVAGDSLLTWNGISFDENVFNGAAGWDGPPTVTVGQGFFYKASGTAHTVNWVTIGFP